MTTYHQSHFDRLAHRTHLREIALQKKTCQGCHWLQTWPRPQCKGEGSPHYRMVRDTYHDRCDQFCVRPPEAAAPVVPPVPPPVLSRHRKVTVKA